MGSLWGKHYAPTHCHMDRFDAPASAFYGCGIMGTAKFFLVAVMAVASCSRGSGDAATAGGLSPDQFVDVMVELQLSQPHQRDGILKKHQTNEEAIRAFVLARTSDPVALGVVFDSIQTRVDRARVEAEAPE